MFITVFGFKVMTSCQCLAEIDKAVFDFPAAELIIGFMRRENGAYAQLVQFIKALLYLGDIAVVLDAAVQRF